MNLTRVRDFTVLVALIGLISWLALSDYMGLALLAAVVTGLWGWRMVKQRQAG